jgi:hypothetical protein
MTICSILSCKPTNHRGLPFLSLLNHRKQLDKGRVIMRNDMFFTKGKPSFLHKKIFYIWSQFQSKFWYSSPACEWYWIWSCWHLHRQTSRFYYFSSHSGMNYSISAMGWLQMSLFRSIAVVRCGRPKRHSCK